MSVLRAYLSSLPLGFVPADLLGADASRTPAGSRLLVTAVALSEPTRASGVWSDLAVLRQSPITVLSVLLELKEMGVLANIERVAGGYRVEEGRSV